MAQNIKIFLICCIGLGALDFVWLGLIMNHYYTERLRPVARIVDGKLQPVLWAGVIVYAALAIAILEFALPRVTAVSSPKEVFFTGALLGLVIYATYDFTNYSTLKDWPLTLSVVDSLWGAFLCGAVTGLARYVRDV